MTLQDLKSEMEQSVKDVDDIILKLHQVHSCNDFDGAVSKLNKAIIYVSAFYNDLVEIRKHCN